MTTHLSGICKKPFKVAMQPFEKMPFETDDKEYGYEVGDSISVSLKEGHYWYDERNSHRYIVRINYKSFELSRQEVEELIDIQFEYGAYNACIKNGIPCNNLRGFTEDETERSKQGMNSWCRISWEVGRGGNCAAFE